MLVDDDVDINGSQKSSKSNESDNGSCEYSVKVEVGVHQPARHYEYFILELQGVWATSG